MEHTYAAVDLGSNSFHLLIARASDGRMQPIDKLKERVRLAAGLTPERGLRPEVAGRALKCLEQFGHRLAHVPSAQVRVVGTNTLRKLAEPDAFIARAEAALGHRIEVISGAEEARLVYRGVSHDLGDTGGRKLVVDIGGGSTECVIGEGPTILRADSLYMGCVEFTQRYFASGRITAKSFDKAVVAARLEVGSSHRPYKRLGWARAIGSSGTINAVQRVLTQNGITDHQITADGLDWLTKQLLTAGRTSAVDLLGLKPERAPVFPGGVAILVALFRSLRIDSMVASGAALREGVLYDLLGQAADHDIRDETVRRMRDRFGADPHHARRVARLAMTLLDQAAEPWGLDAPMARRMLEWGAHLHEIGKAIAYAGYHRHGAYLVAHSDMPGFGRREQAQLAAMLQGQRRKLRPEQVSERVGLGTEEALRLTVLLRLATRLTRTRSPNPRPPIGLAIDGQRLHLSFPDGWLDERPLTRADLEAEAQRFAEAGFEISWG